LIFKENICLALTKDQCETNVFLKIHELMEINSSPTERHRNKKHEKRREEKEDE